MKKLLKGLLIIMLAAVIGTAAFFINAFFGNPVSYLLARGAVKRYLADTYGDTDFSIDRVTYNFKINGYSAAIGSETSIDSHFSVSTDMLGRITGDAYEYVSGGWNTWLRIDEAYRVLVDEVFADPSFDVSYSIGYGEIRQLHKADDRPGAEYGLDLDTLEIDGEYDIRALGAQAGHIVLYVWDETCTFDKAARVLLRVRELFDAAGVPFYAIDLVVHPNEKPVDTADAQVHVSDFLYEDIAGDDLAQRIEEAHNVLSQWYESQDAIKNQASSALPN